MEEDSSAMVQVVQTRRLLLLLLLLLQAVRRGSRWIGPSEARRLLPAAEGCDAVEVFDVQPHVTQAQGLVSGRRWSCRETSGPANAAVVRDVALGAGPLRRETRDCSKQASRRAGEQAGRVCSPGGSQTPDSRLQTAVSSVQCPVSSPRLERKVLEAPCTMDTTAAAARRLDPPSPPMVCCW